MTKELERELHLDFPHLLKRFRSNKPNSSLIISCDDGWYDIIYDCFTKIVFIQSACNYIKILEITEIKEKFGQLVIRHHFEGEKTIEKIIADIIKSATESSKKICEVSGNYGTLCSDTGKYKTLSYEVVRNNPKYTQYHPISNSIAELWIHNDNKPAFQ